VKEVFGFQVKFHKKSRLMWTTYFTDITGVMSLTPSFSFTWLWALESSWSQCLWGLGGGHHFVCLEILVLQHGWSSKGQLSFVLTYVITDRCIWLPTFFSYFSASLLLTLLHSGAIPPLFAKTRGLNEDFSMLITFWLEYEV